MYKYFGKDNFGHIKEQNSYFNFSEFKEKMSFIKMHFLCFLPVLGLMSNSLTTISVESH